jgi:serine/threonine protein kinase
MTAKSDNDPLVGTIIRERYRLEHKLGKGAMGVVYKASHLHDGRNLAIKILHTHLASDAESLKRFEQEAKAASTLMHQNIVRLYEVGMMPVGQPYIAMEFVEGETLAESIRNRHHYNTREALPVIRQVCLALAEAHSLGVVHRDIKPANIMLTHRFGQENFVVVLDFSISKVIEKVSDVDTTTSGALFGSPAYMSPERFQGHGGDFRTDIYSMGIIMFQLLAGRPPFKSSDLYKLMNDHVSQIPPKVTDINPDSDIPDGLQAVISQALEKRPEDRQANMKQLLMDIDQIYSDFSRHSQSFTQPQLTLPAVPTLQSQADYSRTPAAAMNVSRGDAPVFDINPGLLTPGLISSGNIPAARKAAGLDDPTKAAGSGSASTKWDKRLVATQTDRQRPVIRPPETQRFPIELLVLLAVLLIGLTAIGATFLAPQSHTSTDKHDGKR